MESRTQGEPLFARKGEPGEPAVRPEVLAAFLNIGIRVPANQPVNDIGSAAQVGLATAMSC